MDRFCYHRAFVLRDVSEHPEACLFAARASLVDTAAINACLEHRHLGGEAIRVPRLAIEEATGRLASMTFECPASRSAQQRADMLVVAAAYWAEDAPAVP